MDALRRYYGVTREQVELVRANVNNLEASLLNGKTYREVASELFLGKLLPEAIKRAHHYLLRKDRHIVYADGSWVDLRRLKDAKEIPGSVVTAVLSDLSREIAIDVTEYLGKGDRVVVRF